MSQTLVLNVASFCQREKGMISTDHLCKAVQYAHLGIKEFLGKKCFKEMRGVIHSQKAPEKDSLDTKSPQKKTRLIQKALTN